MFTYNFRRLLNLIGIALFRKLILALKVGDIEAIKAEIEEYVAHMCMYMVYFLDYFGFYKFKPIYLRY